MKFKKLLSALAVSSLFAAGTASATPFVIDVNQFDTTPMPGTDGKTAPVARLALNWLATSVYTDTNGSGSINFGDAVSDSGAGSVGYLDAGNNVIGGFENNEGSGGSHQLLFSYSNLLGTVVFNDGAGGIGAIYGSGTISLFNDNNVDGDHTDAGEGEVMKLGVFGSTGTIGNFSLFAKVLSADANTFFFNGVTDINALLLNINVTTNFNNSPLVPTSLGGAPQQWTRTTTLNGNTLFDVPEPGVIALLGLGLFGLGVARRNNKSA